jgi:hypothetical protein
MNKFSKTIRTTALAVSLTVSGCASAPNHTHIAVIPASPAAQQPQPNFRLTNGPNDPGQSKVTAKAQVAALPTISAPITTTTLTFNETPADATSLEKQFPDGSDIWAAVKGGDFETIDRLMGGLDTSPFGNAYYASPGLSTDTFLPQLGNDASTETKGQLTITTLDLDGPHGLMRGANQNGQKTVPDAYLDAGVERFYDGIRGDPLGIHQEVPDAAHVMDQAKLLLAALKQLDGKPISNLDQSVKDGGSYVVELLKAAHKQATAHDASEVMPVPWHNLYYEIYCRRQKGSSIIGQIYDQIRTDAADNPQ